MRNPLRSFEKIVEVRKWALLVGRQRPACKQLCVGARGLWLTARLPSACLIVESVRRGLKVLPTRAKAEERNRYPTLNSDAATYSRNPGNLRVQWGNGFGICKSRMYVPSFGVRATTKMLVPLNFTAFGGTASSSHTVCREFAID